jgi:lipopolysaccharide export system protein LptA
MPLPIYRLRRLLAATAIVLTVVVAGMYFYARSRATNVLKTIPGKIGYDIKQTANGFQFSKSDGKRTLFRIEARELKQFKLNGLAELHDVNIVLYGRDSSRFDQVYGDDFSYDPQSGNVTAKGEVQIDLVANPAGLTSPDQTTPKDLKNPIHLKTRDLVFNKDTGDAATDARVEFRTPQATGWAVGVKYAGKSNLLILNSQIHVVVNGPDAAVIDAQHGVITNEPHQIVLDHPRLTREGATMQADNAIFHLGPDNNVERVEATGNVTSEARLMTDKSSPKADNGPGQTDEASNIRSHADQAEFLLTGKQNLLRTATLTGNVHVEQAGPQPIEGDAGRVIMEFAGQNELQKVHALDGARLAQKSAGTKNTNKNSAADGGPQDFELTAPTIDFTVIEGHLLDRAVTSGPAQITITPAQTSADASNGGSTRSDSPKSGSAKSGQRTVVTAGKFDAKFETTHVESTDASSSNGRPEVSNRTQIKTIHGAPDARIVNSTPGEPDRVSTSEAVDAVFLPQGGIDSLTQHGNFVYSDGQKPDKRTQAWASNARYTPADQVLTLTGSPRVENGSVETTANVLRMYRATNEAVAEGDVKSTYSELKEQPNGALLASSSPIHVTAHTMTAGNHSGIALYTGNARLWQDANIIEAPSIQFDRDHRFVTAQGTASAPVLTTLVQARNAQAAKPDSVSGSNQASGANVAGANAGATSRSKSGGGKPGRTEENSAETDPIAITAARLTYADSERKVHYEGGVRAKGTDFTATAKTADAFLLPRSQTAGNQSVTGPESSLGRLDHMIAQDDVVIQEPNRRAEGQKLVYTAADDKFVLTGGTSKELPSIFDAERGKITGVSLTFFRSDDRVLVEGEASTPVVTQTRVAR